MRLPLVFGLLILAAAQVVWADGNPEAGSAKAMTYCGNCHGASGIGGNPALPRLAGQHAAYLLKQIDDFKNGRRPSHETMQMIGRNLPRQDVEDIVAFYAAQPLPPPESVEKRLIQAGREIYMGQLNCFQCHRDDGTGEPGGRLGAVPSVAGQSRAYLAKSMRDFRSGARTNDLSTLMNLIMPLLTDEMIDAVAAYMSTLPNSMPTPPVSPPPAR